MQLPPRAARVVRLLRRTLESDHFIVHFGPRDRPEGRGLGSLGIRDRRLVLTYLDALERLYTAMTAQPLERQLPGFFAQRKVNVYIVDISQMFPEEECALTSVDEKRVPYIALPCRTNEPTIRAELDRAAAEAVHEATHVFNMRERPLYVRDSDERPLLDPYHWPWAWFDEATATFMESVVLAGNHDTLRFGLDWSDRPESSLDDWSACYEAWMFVRYLAKRFGLGFISKVWTEAAEDENPIETLTRLLDKDCNNSVFSSPKPDTPDIFASGYCLDSYFLWDPESPGYAPEVYARYGERAVTESFVLQARSRASSSDSLHHLSCRYYRLYIGSEVSTLEVRLSSQMPNHRMPLKVELAVVTTEMKRGPVGVLRPADPVGPEEPVRLCARVNNLDANRIDHLVLVVTNCGLRSSPGGFNGEHDDGVAYELTLSVS